MAMETPSPPSAETTSYRQLFQLILDELDIFEKWQHNLRKMAVFGGGSGSTVISSKFHIVFDKSNSYGKSNDCCSFFRVIPDINTEQVLDLTTSNPPPPLCEFIIFLYAKKWL